MRIYIFREKKDNTIQKNCMTPEELRKHRLKLGLSIKEMSELLSTPYRTYQDWEHGRRRIPGICQEAVLCFLHCRGAVKKRFKRKKKKGGKHMGKERVLFKTEEPKSARDTAAFLRLLADKLEAGTISLKGGGQEVTLDIPANITLEIKVEEETKKAKIKKSLEIEIEWYPGDGDDQGGVTIA